MAMLKRNLTIALIVAALVAVTAVAAIAQGGSRPGDGYTQATAIEQAASDAASILETTRTSGDEIDSELADKIDEVAGFGVNTDLSRRAIASISNSVYLLPGTGYVCAALTVAEGATLTCAETPDLTAGEVGPGTVSLPGGAIAIWGIVPDGVDSVDIDAGVDSTEVGTEGNAYLAVVPEGAEVATATYTGPSGEMEYDIHDPSAPEPDPGP